MENYDLKQELLLHDIFERINRKLIGLEYNLRPNDKYHKIDFGEGVELFLSSKYNQVIFRWNSSIKKILEANIQMILWSLFTLVIFLTIGDISNWPWNNIFWLFLSIAFLSIFIITWMTGIPVALINSRTHLMKTQLLLNEIISEFGSGRQNAPPSV